MGKSIPFVKIHGAGNDCIFFRAADLPPKIIKADFVRGIADRRTGIGADQVLERLPQSDFAVQVWNCDGSQAEMCGNGARCFAALLDREGALAPGENFFSLEISGRSYQARRQGREYSLCLGSPKNHGLLALPYRGHDLPYYFISAPNPHAVFFFGEGTNEVSEKMRAGYDFPHWGKEIECHARFPQRTNVEFVKKISPRADGEWIAEVEAWERGAGATPSCGSGAVAVAAAMRARQPEISKVIVKMTKYELGIHWEGENIFLTGPTAFVARGEYFYE